MFTRKLQLLISCRVSLTLTLIYIYIFICTCLHLQNTSVGDTFLSLYCTDLLSSCPHKYVLKDFKTRGVKRTREYKKS